MDWFIHIEGELHINSQRDLLLKHPGWDPTVSYTRRKDVQSEFNCSSPSDNSAKSSQMGEGSKVLGIKFKHTLTERFIRRLLQDFGEIVKICTLRAMAFVEMGSAEQSRSIVQYFNNKPLKDEVYGSQISFFLSSNFKNLQSGRVVTFSPLPAGMKIDSEILAVAKRFGPVKYSLILPTLGYVEMCHYGAAKKLVENFATSPLKINRKKIQVQYSTEFETIKDFVDDNEGNSKDSTVHKRDKPKRASSQRDSPSPKRRRASEESRSSNRNRSKEKDSRHSTEMEPSKKLSDSSKTTTGRTTKKSDSSAKRETSKKSDYSSSSKRESLKKSDSSSSAKKEILKKSDYSLSSKGGTSKKLSSSSYSATKKEKAPCSSSSSVKNETLKSSPEVNSRCLSDQDSDSDFEGMVVKVDDGEELNSDTDMELDMQNMVSVTEIHLEEPKTVPEVPTEEQKIVSKEDQKIVSEVHTEKQEMVLEEDKKGEEEMVSEEEQKTVLEVCTMEQKTVPEVHTEEQKIVLEEDKKGEEEMVSEEEQKTIPEFSTEEQKIVLEEDKKQEVMVSEEEQKTVPEEERKTVPEVCMEEHKTGPEVCTEERKTILEVCTEEQKTISEEEQKTVPEVRMEEQKTVPEVCAEEQKTSPEEEQKTVPEVCAEEQKTISEEEQKTVPEVRTEEQKTVPEVCAEEQKTAPEEEQKTVPEVCTEKQKTAPEEEQKTVPEVCTEERKTVPEVRAEEQKMVPEVCMEKHKTVPEEEQKTIPEVCKKEQKMVPEVHTEEQKTDPEDCMEEQKTVPDVYTEKQKTILKVEEQIIASVDALETSVSQEPETPISEPEKPTEEIPSNLKAADLNVEQTDDMMATDTVKTLGKVLYVKNLPLEENYTDDDFINLISRYGKVMVFQLFHSLKKGFVEMKNASDAEKIAADSKNKDIALRGNILKVDVSKKYSSLPSEFSYDWDSDSEEGNQNQDATSICTSDAGVESLEPKEPVGTEFIRSTVGFFCDLCKVFYADEEEAKDAHCRSSAHHDKVKEHNDKSLSSP